MTLSGGITVRQCFRTDNERYVDVSTDVNVAVNGVGYVISCNIRDAQAHFIFCYDLVTGR